MGFCVVLDATPVTLTDKQMDQFYKMMRADRAVVPLGFAVSKCVVRVKGKQVDYPALLVPIMSSLHRRAACKETLREMRPDTCSVTFVRRRKHAKDIYEFNRRHAPRALNRLVMHGEDHPTLSLDALKAVNSGQAYRVVCTISAGARGLDLPPASVTLVADAVKNPHTLIQMMARGRSKGDAAGVVLWFLKDKQAKKAPEWIGKLNQDMETARDAVDGTKSAVGRMVSFE